MIWLGLIVVVVILGFFFIFFLVFFVCGLLNLLNVIFKEFFVLCIFYDFFLEVGFKFIFVVEEFYIFDLLFLFVLDIEDVG